MKYTLEVKQLPYSEGGLWDVLVWRHGKKRVLAKSWTTLKPSQVDYALAEAAVWASYLDHTEKSRLRKAAARYGGFKVTP